MAVEQKFNFNFLLPGAFVRTGGGFEMATLEAGSDGQTDFQITDGITLPIDEDKLPNAIVDFRGQFLYTPTDYELDTAGVFEYKNTFGDIVTGETIRVRV